MAYKKAVFCLCKENQIQEEYTPKICLRKLKIIGPRFHSLKKLILVGGYFREGVDDQEKHPKDALHEKN